ncbi:MAG: T9SS type A sorting domain-containing protein [Bacteroidales bacterium]|nr:T9SS type A sorting domain-containing protein [Bacteroidales bacterium]
MMPKINHLTEIKETEVITDKNVLCDIYNSKGKHILTSYTTINSDGEVLNLNLNDLPKGHYLLKISSTTFTKFMRVKKLS